MSDVVPEWLEAFRAGDLNQFAELIAEHQDHVFSVANALVLDRALAEDVAQETFIRAYQHRDRLRDASALRAWLAAIARNIGRDLLRARRREPLVETEGIELACDAVLQSDELEATALREGVRAALAQVPAKYREVLTLYYFNEHSIDAVAQSLGLSQSAALQRLSRGRKLVERHGANLRDLLEQRPRKSFALSVLALLAMRRHAAAQTSRVTKRSRWVHGVVGVGLVLALMTDDRPSLADGAPGESCPAPSPSAETPVLSPSAGEAARTPPRAEPTRRVPARSKRPAAAALVEPVKPNEASVDPSSARAGSAASIGSTPTTPAAPVIVAATVPPGDTMSVQCSPCAAPPVPAIPAIAADRMDTFNGFLETAALPAPGDLSFETRPMGMELRAGIHRNVAVHVGMMGVDIVEGSYRNAGMAFGGGLKLGMNVATARVAVVGEIAREVNVKTFDPGPEWLGRAYAALTLGDARTHVTLTGGVTAIDNGDPRWVSPTFGVGTYLGWDTKLGFVLESQYFTTPKMALSATSVLGVRFRNHSLERNALRMERVRVDVGVLLLHEGDEDVDGLPWLQAALGW